MKRKEFALIIFSLQVIIMNSAIINFNGFFEYDNETKRYSKIYQPTTRYLTYYGKIKQGDIFNYSSFLFPFYPVLDFNQPWFFNFCDGKKNFLNLKI
jgi:hypothetical protein